MRRHYKKAQKWGLHALGPPGQEERRSGLGMGKGPLKGLGLCRFLPSPDRKSNAKASLAVQWLRCRTSTARGHSVNP